MYRKTGWGGDIVKRIPIQEIQKASETIRDTVVRTPLVTYDPLSNKSDLFLKPEILQPIGSFKLRGAFNWASSLSENQREKGLSTISAGNTAQAVAYTARIFGVKSKSIVPASAPQVKLDAITSLGAQIVPLEGDELWKYFFEPRWDKEEFNFLNPWANPKMLAGNGTVGMEIIQDLPDVETVFVPVGGGGLVGGVGSAIKQLKPKVKIIGVQPENYGALKACFKENRSVWVETKPTICDGVAVPLIVDEMYPLLREVIDDVILISEKQVKQTIKKLMMKNKIIVEGAGALATAAALSIPDSERTTSVAILSGSSIQPEKLLQILND